MLTVYSTYGAPGASTTALYLAAHYASTGRPTLLIDADGDAGSLSQLLGIQHTPGTASFLAGGKPVSAANLIDHAQDVVFDDLHIMPAPSDPVEARRAAAGFAAFGDELRDISDSDMAVIVDGGRLAAGVGTSTLTACAAAVLVVAADQSDFPSLEHVNGILVSDASEPGPLGLAAAVGPSALTAAQWKAEHGLEFVGSIGISTERNINLSMFMGRPKRALRRFRDSIEQFADALYEYACPASAPVPRRRLAAPAAGDAGAESHAESEPDADAEPTAVADEAPPLNDFGADFGAAAAALAAAAAPAEGAYPGADPALAVPAPPGDLHPPPPDAPAVPTGSFRSWAEQLYGSPEEAEPDDSCPRPGRGEATA